MDQKASNDKLLKAYFKGYFPTYNANVATNSKRWGL